MKNAEKNMIIENKNELFYTHFQGNMSTLFSADTLDLPINDTVTNKTTVLHRRFFVLDS